MVQPTLQEISLKKVHEPFLSNSRGPICEERRLQIEKLDEWRAHKPRTHEKPKIRQNKLNTFPNQLKVGHKVLLDAADPHIITAKPNEEIPLTVHGIFPFGTVEGKDFPNMGYDKLLRPCDMAMGEPTKTKWRATRPCLETVAEPIKVTRACYMFVPSNCGQTCQNNMGVDLHTRTWEKRTETDTAVRHGRVHQHSQSTWV
ncbi:hypothetical protein GOBAR_AA32872 [Gossypium barbadense]|uniref:Uncharacterized protein n=1 Tax=Gossypium barbadense TaxID=3634 RepID=A0A2P5W9T1_GOSBA|nr:hypothetical protein GOBAR_AA32872 [Gossypium barbadense]